MQRNPAVAGSMLGKGTLCDMKTDIVKSVEISLPSAVSRLCLQSAHSTTYNLIIKAISAATNCQSQSK